MLLELRVKDLGIIEDIDWKLDQGLNVITGETGAGKSLVIDAVELLLTGTASDHPPGGVPGGQSRRSSGKKAHILDPHFLSVNKISICQI